jgi:hypothetical protein
MPRTLTRPRLGRTRPVIRFRSVVLPEPLGLVEHGFARLWCPVCRTSVLCPFSCRGRSFCPSCEKKRQLLWAEWLQKEVLAPVPHRHVVLTMPRLLRGIFRKRRELLLDLSQCAAESVAEYVRRRLGPDCRPGIVVSIATASDLVQWHPHGHLLTTDGGFCEDGAFHRLEGWDAEGVMKLFRERLLARLVEHHAISEELARKLVAWTHPGFSSHVAEAIPFENKKAIEDLACYLVRAPFSLQKLVYLDGHKAVLYRSRLNPSLGRNFEALDPLEWLARLADHIPDPGRHRTHFYAYYANRVRGERPGEDEPRPADEAEPTTRRRCSPTWARLIAKVFQADPLVCRRCGGPLKVVAYVTDSLVITQILQHLDLSPPEKPPPDIRDVVRVPVDEEGRELEVQPA